MSGIAPILLSIQVCDSVIADHFTGRASVINIIETIAASKFPARHPHITFFCEFVNGHGKSDVIVKLVDVQNDDKVINEVKGEMIFQNVKQISRLVMNFGGIVFPHEGEYRFQLYLNNELTAERRLVCKQVQLPRKPEQI